MDNYMLHHMLMERERSSQAQDPAVFRNSPRLRRSKQSRESVPRATPSRTREPAGDAPHAFGTPTREAIARRAFEIYLERGRGEGQDVEDWLQAERELQAGLQDRMSA